VDAASSNRRKVQLIKKRGQPLRKIGFRILGLGAVASLGIDLITWLLTREGNLVRIALGFVLLGGAVAAIGTGLLIDQYDKRKLRI
jgi:hypothetical protein